MIVNDIRATKNNNILFTHTERYRWDNTQMLLLIICFLCITCNAPLMQRVPVKSPTSMVDAMFG